MIKKLFILFLMFFLSMSLHANYSPALDWNRGDLSTSGFNYSLVSVSDKLENAEDLEVAAILLNAFLGWGIGSFVQGDIKSGVIQLLFHLAGYSSLGAGYGSLSALPYASASSSSLVLGLGITLSALGSGILIGNLIFGLLAPSKYIKSLERNLKTSYNFKKYNDSLIDKTVTYNVTLANF